MTLESLTLSKEISFEGNQPQMTTSLFVNRTMNREYEVAEYYSTLQDLSLEDLQRMLAAVSNLIETEETPRIQIMPKKTVNFRDPLYFSFLCWAYQYFAKDSGHLNRNVSGKDAYGNLCALFYPYKNWSIQVFKQGLEYFATECPYIAELNPKELCNADGYITEKQEDGSVEYMIHMRTISEGGR